MSLRIKEPAAKRKTLIFTAGTVWLIVGTMLAAVAIMWLSASSPSSYPLGALGLLTGLIVSRYGFSRILKRNVERIKALSPHKDRICIFAFQAIQSYLLILVMAGLGYTLRQLPIPHVYLAAIYLTIGVALFRSGLDYIKAARAL